MTATMLGCPHCRKPIGSVPRIAGQPVSCPYCRRPFQMPGAPAPPAKAVPQLRVEAQPPEKVKSEPAPTVVKVREPLDPYQSVNMLADRFVLVGSAAILLAGVLIALTSVVPLFSATNDRPAEIGTGIVSSLLMVACVAVGMTAILLVRALIRVGVETARAVRPTQPEAVVKSE
jgi:hypothetical protein